MQKGIVKCVLSGDTIVVRNNPVAGKPPMERVLNLAYVQSPRLGRRDDQGDEYYAFESREFLRKMLVGKLVEFKVEYKTMSGRENVILVFNGQNVAELSVQNGCTQLRTKDAIEQVQLLIQYEAEAQERGLGIWAKFGDDSRSVVSINYSPQIDALQLVKKYGKQEVPVIIERVNDAGNFKVLTSDYQMFNFALSAIQCPIYRKDVPGQEDLVESYAEEAKFFVESRLLQRSVNVVFEGAVGQNFYGTVIHPAGNIAELLLANGFAKIVDWQLSSLSADADKYKSALQEAQSKQLRIWNQSPVTYQSSLQSQQKQSQSSIGTGKKQFDGIVTRIVTADTLTIGNPSDLSQERKISLSSFRPPRAKDEKESFYNLEAREYMRSKLIGQKVHVSVEYEKEGGQDYDDKTCATVTMGPLNIAEALITKGFGYVMRHKKDDNDRSHHYDQLLMAEDKAKSGKKGVWSDKLVPIIRINDASESATKAKSFLNAFQRAGQIQAVVEYVSNAGRLRLYLPKQQCKLSFLLAGVKVPRSGRTSQDKSEPFADEATAYVSRLILQHDVLIEVDNIDKGGNFIGNLQLMSGDKSNLAIKLVEKGFASVWYADKLKFAQQLYEAESRAKNSKFGIWSVSQPSSESGKVSQVQQKQEFKPYSINVEVVRVIDAGRIAAKLLSEGPKEKELRLAFVKAPPINSDYGPDAKAYLESAIVDSKQFQATVEYQLAGEDYVTLYYANHQSILDSVNAELVSGGWAQVDSKIVAGKDSEDDKVKELLYLQREAKMDRIGMFEYGDYSLDEDE
ncbi:hypothetical protein MP228_003101 [Amoeboaphelidium protococcarum]|nr:hypothetical protein MP228_003101 [Amoeboaphelidium protococcarum]